MQNRDISRPCQWLRRTGYGASENRDFLHKLGYLAAQDRIYKKYIE